MPEQASWHSSEIFTGENAWCKDCFTSAKCREAIPLSNFLECPFLKGRLRNYAQTFKECDPRATASYWSLFYCARLITPYLLAAKNGIVLPLTDLSISIEPSGLPKSFHYSPEKVQYKIFDATIAVRSLIDSHLEYFISQMKQVAGLSQKLLWNNAAVYIDHALKSATRCPANEDVTCGKTSICNMPWFFDGRPNPISNCLKYEEISGNIICRRKLCCLRYQLPGIPTCGELCAKSEIRAQSARINALSSLQI